MMQIERITSGKNQLISHIRKLQGSRSYRESCGEFVADGFKLLDEALRWYPKLKTVILTEGAPHPPLPEHIRCVEIPASLMESLSSMKSPQGVIFTGSLPANTSPVLHRGMLLLDRIQDPGNLGTILRTADAMDVPVLLTNGCADPFSEKTIRASMGAVFRTEVQSIAMEELLRQCEELNLPLAATALTDAASDLRTVDLRDYIMVIGSEGQGICKELLQASKKQIIIPMQGRCESLNAAVAATIVLWELRNRYK